MKQIKIYEYRDSRWIHIRDEQLDSYEFNLALEVIKKQKQVDLFYKIELVDNGISIASLLTINPFILDGKAA